ncbi:aldehyde dehydrogenase (NAD+) [Rhizobium sp. BK313]|uniref:aldehyde dehydrogenase n=1 Tax=Rhizobium sp. BK313 TaxID=2587081 RepID=UPI00105D3569|nr:aldehyde dehydrogenase [Rhizobium sp. BK313]MBB3452787.1 aldehyde dehydrogenase (NAD+) [Rhizobium sp. BK313]
MEQFQMRIGGVDRGAIDGGTYDSLDPFKGENWATFPRANSKDVDLAVRSAHQAFRSGAWKTMTATQRGLLLHKIGDILTANAERLADLEVKNNGKIKAEMLKQMLYLPHWFYYYGGLCDKIEGQVTPFDKPGVFHYTTYEPLGVVAAIAPWNSPLLLAVWKIAPALAAGNTVVMKPSEFSSASSVLFVQLCEEAGLPAGVLNVVTGFGKEVGEPLDTHPMVARVAFTGSEGGGRSVYENAAKTFKRVSLELGGKSANIVFEDADLENALRGAVTGIFSAAGQSCMAGSRLLVHASIHDEFVSRLVEFMSDAKLGDPLDPRTDIGPVSNQPQLEKTLSYIEIAKAEGAVCAMGGGRSTRPGLEKGLFVEPTIFIGVNNKMRIAREEVFGPVLAVLPFQNDEEAVAIANDSDYGLAAGVWTSSLTRAMSIPKQLEAGSVWVNTYRLVSYMAPFGGVKSSGIGRENGSRAIYEYLEAKSVFINQTPKTESPFIFG